MTTSIRSSWWLGFVLVLAAPTMARAQWVNSHFQNRVYEAQSHGRWMAERQMFYGPMGTARKTVHDARRVVDEVVHVAKRVTGNPDFQHYSRYDRRSLGLLGPSPSAAMGGGFGYGGGYGGAYGGGYGGAYGGAYGGGYGMGGMPYATTPVVGFGGNVNGGGGATVPTRRLPGSNLNW